MSSVRRFGLLAGVAAVIVCGLQPVAAQTLDRALAAAYANNPTLAAQRAAQRATDEGVPQALSGWRPTVTFSSEAGRARQLYDPNSASLRDQTLTPFTNSLSLSQPLYRGGRTVASTQSAEALVQAGRATLASTEQQVFLQVVTAYADVVRDQAVLELNRNNEQVLRRNLEATQDRFRVGEITRTDVSQSEARLSRATSDRISAEGALAASRAIFERVVGEAPRQLVQPDKYPQPPAARDEVLRVAMAENPDLIAATWREESSRYDIRAASGALLPSVSLNASAVRAEESTTRDLVSESAKITAQVTVPLYESGSVYSQVRQRRQVNSQRRLQIDETRRLVQQTAVQAWENLVTARANIISRRAQIEASRVALEGVTQEAQVGARTTLDVLDSEQEFLDSRVALVRAQREELVAVYTLLSALGRLTARNLGLSVDLYDPVENYNRVRDKWFGTDGGLD